MERGKGSGFPEPAQGCGGGPRGGSGPAATRGQPRPPQTALGAPGGAAVTIHPQSRGFGTLFCGYFAGCCLHGALAHPFYSLCILFPLIPLAGVTVAVSTRKGFSLCWYSTARFVFTFFGLFSYPHERCISGCYFGSKAIPPARKLIVWWTCLYYPETYSEVTLTARQKNILGVMDIVIPGAKFVLF